MTATLKVTRPSFLGDGGVRVVVDCRHGTTYVDMFLPKGKAAPLSKRTLIRTAALRHEEEEGCGCARSLETIAKWDQ